MLWIINYAKKRVDALYTIRLPKFLRDFLSAMDNSPIGQSLKKWLAVGFFWIITVVTIENTSKENLLEVLVTLCSTLTLLLGIEHVFKYKVKKLENKGTETTKTVATKDSLTTTETIEKTDE